MFSGVIPPLYYERGPADSCQHDVGCPVPCLQSRQREDGPSHFERVDLSLCRYRLAAVFHNGTVSGRQKWSLIQSGEPHVFDAPVVAETRKPDWLFYDRNHRLDAGFSVPRLGGQSFLRLGRRLDLSDRSHPDGLAGVGDLEGKMTWVRWGSLFLALDGRRHDVECKLARIESDQ